MESSAEEQLEDAQQTSPSVNRSDHSSQTPIERLRNLIFAYLKFHTFYFFLIVLPTIIITAAGLKGFDFLYFFYVNITSQHNSMEGLGFIFLLPYVYFILIAIVHVICLRLFVHRFFVNFRKIVLLVLIHSIIVFILLPSFYILKVQSESSKKRNEDDTQWRKHADQYVGAVTLSNFHDEFTNETIDGEQYVKLRILATIEVKQDGEYQFYYRLRSGISSPQGSQKYKYRSIINGKTFKYSELSYFLYPLQATKGKSQFVVDFFFEEKSLAAGFDAKKIVDKQSFAFDYYIERRSQIPKSVVGGPYYKDSTELEDWTFHVQEYQTYETRVYKSYELLNRTRPN